MRPERSSSLDGWYRAWSTAGLDVSSACPPTAAQTGGGNYSKSSYAAAKNAIEGLSRAVAREVAPYGVTVNVVAPATIDTDIMGGPITPERAPGFIAGLPVGRIGTVEEVAALIEFLLGENAGYITGATYNINGGLRIG